MEFNVVGISLIYILKLDIIEMKTISKLPAKIINIRMKGILKDFPLILTYDLQMHRTLIQAQCKPLTFQAFFWFNLFLKQD